MKRMNEFRIQVGRNWYTFNIGEWWTKHTVLTEMVPAAVNVFLDKVEQALEENEDVGEVVRVIHDAICTIHVAVLQHCSILTLFLNCFFLQHVVHNKERRQDKNVSTWRHYYERGTIDRSIRCLWYRYLESKKMQFLCNVDASLFRWL